jgi:hypothetical protein
MGERYDGERGQVLVLAALMMTAMLGFLALVLDVGNAYAQRRFVQNGADAAAIAAARLLGNNLDTGTADASVAAVLDQYLDANGQGTFVAGAALDADEGAWYVTAGGNRIASVGSGVTIPAAPLRGFPQMNGQSVAGVEVVGRKEFDTFFAGVLGYDRMTVRAAGMAGFGGVGSVLLDSTRTGVTVGPIAFDVDALRDPAFGNCGGYGANLQYDQFIDIPTECIFDSTAHFSFTTLDVGSNCSQSTVNDTIDRLIDDPESFGSRSLVIDETDIQICSGTRMSGLDRFISLNRPFVIPLVRHTQAAACNSNCVARVVGFAYVRLTRMTGHGSNAYAEGYWVDPRTMPTLRNAPVSTTTTTILGPVAVALLRLRPAAS